MCYQLSNHSCSLSWGHYRQFNCPYRPLQSPWPVLTQITQQWPLSCETYFLPFGKRLSFGGKSNRDKKALPKKAKKDVLHKDVVLLPSPDARLVLTHQMQWLMENSGFFIHAFPVDKSLQEEDFRAQIRVVGETNFNSWSPTKNE